MKSKIKTNLKKVKEKLNLNSLAIPMAFLSQTELLKYLEKLTEGAATVYDKALDLDYLKTKIGGGDHRLFDGGHDLFGAFERAKAALPDDTFAEEFFGAMSALWKDFSTVKGLPLFTVSKDGFDKSVEFLSNKIPGLDREYLYDLLSFDAFELLNVVLSSITAIGLIKKKDQEKLSELLGSMGIITILSANPIMGIFVAAIAGWAYFKTKMKFDKKIMMKSAAFSGISVGLFSLLGLPVIVELVVVIIIMNILRKKFDQKNFDVLKNRVFTLVREAKLRRPSFVKF